jgi:hypothetical protein
VAAYVQQSRVGGSKRRVEIYIWDKRIQNKEKKTRIKELYYA